MMSRKNARIARKQLKKKRLFVDFVAEICQKRKLFIVKNEYLCGETPRMGSK